MNYFILTIFSTLFFFVHVFSWSMQHLPKDCGVVKKVQGQTNQSNHSLRVINGHQAELGQFPWLAKLGVRNDKGMIKFFCSGSLINRYFVISAAHCEEYADLIRIGENYVDTDEDCDEKGVCAPPHQDIEPKRYIFENYCKGTARNDVMMIELESPAKFNDFVQPVCVLPKPYPIENLVGNRVVVAGWGLTNPFDIESVPSELLHVSLKVLSYEECLRTFSFVKPNHVFCVMDESVKDQRMCVGDSGGAAIISQKENGVERYFLIGVVSFSEPYCGSIGALTNVSHYLEHLLSHVDKS